MGHVRPVHLFLVTAMTALAGCAGVAGPHAPTTSQPAADAGTDFQSDGLDDVPAGPLQVRTTSASVYMGNLDARISALRHAVEQRPPSPLDRVLTASLAHRGRITGRISDLETALERARDYAAARAGDPDGQMALAGQLAAFHHFDQALETLKRARRLGADPDKLAQSRADMLLALGRVNEAEKAKRPFLEDDLAGLAFRANRRVDEGRLREADRLFVEAQRSYHDSNPYPLAWLDVQHGIMFLRARDYRRAKPFFEAAHRRLPQFALATEHLAETEYYLGDYRQAAVLYRKVAKQTGNPTFLAMLTLQERALGDERAAKDAEARAVRGFDDLLSRHPEAYWQHAARSYLLLGRERQALVWARKNTGLRRNLKSLILLARAENAAGNRDRACSAWAEAHASGLNPPEFRVYAGAFANCAAAAD